MAYYDLSSKEYQRKFDTFVLDNAGLIKDYFSLSGHMDKSHTGKTDDEMKLRCINEHTSVSEFLAYQPSDGEFSDVNDIIENALLYASHDIAEWATSEPMDFSDKDPEAYYKKEIDVAFENVIGYGYQNRTLEKMDSPVVRLVMKRDRSDQEFGIKLETAFPLLECESSRYVRQFECRKLDIDPYKDGKLTISPDNLENYRKETMTKGEAKEQIAKEIEGVLREKRDQMLQQEKDLVKEFCRANGVPYNKVSIHTEVDDKGRKSRGVRAYGRTIGYVNVRKGYVSTKYRSMDEVKKQVREEKAKTRDDEER